MKWLYLFLGVFVGIVSSTIIFVHAQEKATSSLFQISENKISLQNSIIENYEKILIGYKTALYRCLQK